MKQILRRGLGLVMALCLLTGLLSGCGSGEDPIKEVMGYSGDTVMFTVDGNDVTASDFFYWMCQNADQVASLFTSTGSEIDWSQTMGTETPLGDYVKESAQQTAILWSVVEAHALEAGYEYTAEDKADFQESLANAQEQLGGEDSFKDWLKSMCVTEKSWEKIASVPYLNYHLLEGDYRLDGANGPTEGEVAQYVADNDILYAKHILLMTVDNLTREPLSDEEKAEKLAKAQEILAELQAIEDPAELEETFDKLMKENSEDGGLETNPDGYVFTAGEMVEAFENGTRALEFGQISGLVETEYGYHIILRLDPIRAEAVQSDVGANKLSAEQEAWVTNAEVVTTDAYDNLTTADFYEKLTAYRESFRTTDDAEEADDGYTEDSYIDDGTSE